MKLLKNLFSLLILIPLCSHALLSGSDNDEAEWTSAAAGGASAADDLDWGSDEEDTPKLITAVTPEKEYTDADIADLMERAGTGSSLSPKAQKFLRDTRERLHLIAITCQIQPPKEGHIPQGHVPQRYIPHGIKRKSLSNQDIPLLIRRAALGGTFTDEEIKFIQEAIEQLDILIPSASRSASSSPEPVEKLPKLVQESIDYLTNLDFSQETDIYTQDSLEERITAQHAAGKPYYLTVVTEQDYDGKRRFYVFDAHSFNHQVFIEYPILPRRRIIRGETVAKTIWEDTEAGQIKHLDQNEDSEKGLILVQNPVSGLPLSTWFINYFSVGLDKKISYLTSFADLISKPTIQQLFYTNEPKE